VLQLHRANAVSSGGTNCLGARNLSWCKNFIACSCGFPGLNLNMDLSYVQERFAKTVTSNLPLALYVLGNEFILIFH
jgi:hypothetical protein